MQDTGEVRPGTNTESSAIHQEWFPKEVGELLLGKETKIVAPSPTNDYGVLLEQINLLRDLLAGKNNWLDDAIKQERARNEKLLAENAALRKEAERLRLGLVEALTIDYRADDSNIDASTFNPLWELTRV